MWSHGWSQVVFIAPAPNEQFSTELEKAVTWNKLLAVFVWGHFKQKQLIFEKSAGWRGHGHEVQNESATQFSWAKKKRWKIFFLIENDELFHSGCGKWADKGAWRQTIVSFFLPAFLRRLYIQLALASHRQCQEPHTCFVFILQMLHLTTLTYFFRNY